MHLVNGTGNSPSPGQPTPGGRGGKKCKCTFLHFFALFTLSHFLHFLHFFAFFCTCFHCPVRVVFALLMYVTQPEAGAQVHTNDEEEENEPGR